MPNPIPAGHIIQLDKDGTKTATISAFDAINKAYTLLDTNGQPFPGSYKPSKWWNPLPPTGDGGRGGTVAPELAPKAAPKTSPAKSPQAAAVAPASVKEQAQSSQSKRPLASTKTQPSQEIQQPSKKTKTVPKKLPLPRGTTIKLNKKGTLSAMIGDYDAVSKRYTLYNKDKWLPGSYEQASFWDPVFPVSKP